MVHRWNFRRLWRAQRTIDRVWVLISRRDSTLGQGQLLTQTSALPQKYFDKASKYQHIDAKRNVLWPSKYAKMLFRPGLHPDPAGGAHNVPPDPLVGWGGDTPPQTPPYSAPSAHRFEVALPLQIFSSRTAPANNSTIWGHPVIFNGSQATSAFSLWDAVNIYFVDSTLPYRGP